MAMNENVECDQPQDESQASENKSDTMNEQKVAEIVNKAISARFKSFDKRLSEFMEQSKAPQKEEVEEKKESKYELLQRQIEQLRQEKNAEIEKRKSDNLKNTIKDMLLQKGVSDKLVKYAVQEVIEKVSYEDDDIVWNNEDGIYSLNDGLSDWMKTEQAKVFMAAKPVTGANNSKFNSNKNVSHDDIRDQLYEWLNN